MLRPFAVPRDACANLSLLSSRYRRAGNGAICGIFATLGKYFGRDKLPSLFCASMSPTCNGGVGMSIETLILVLIVTLAAGFALNWWDAKRNP
jgi:hypothetical protein